MRSAETVAAAGWLISFTGSPAFLEGSQSVVARELPWLGPGLGGAGFFQLLGIGGEMAERKAAGEGTASLEKAIDVLEAIGESGSGLGHLELAERVGLPKTTVYRILSTLVARGLVWRDPMRRVYCLGARTVELARKAY